jgi:predicted ATPase with chaperone activity
VDVQQDDGLAPENVALHLWSVYEDALAMTMESRIDHTTQNGKGRAVHSASETIDAMAFSAAFDAIVDNIETVIKGKTDVVRLSLVAILCEGHILFEDVPGTGKSMLARAIAQSLNPT